MIQLVDMDGSFMVVMLRLLKGRVGGLIFTCSGKKSVLAGGHIARMMLVLV